MINMDLARKRNISEDAIEEIQKCQWYLDEVLENPEVFCESPEDIPGHIKGLEYKLQNLWGFDANEMMHRWWFEVKGCSCPKIDNMETRGYYDIINSDCPYHGNDKAKSWSDGRFNATKKD